MDDEDVDKTTYVKHHGLFRYTKMPFGLKKAPTTVQIAIDAILASTKWQYAPVYIEDILNFC